MVDRSELLTDPFFWAMWYYLHIGTDEVESGELIKPFFGLTDEAVNDFYRHTMLQKKQAHSCVSVRVPFPNGFSLEVAIVEDQGEDRYLLSHDEWASSVLLGYHSAHFALPAFRWQEVRAMERCIRALTSSEVQAGKTLLLFFPGVYLNEADDQDEIRFALTAAWRSLGIVKKPRLSEMVDQIIQNKVNNDVRWRKDARLGWINNGRYSLRNPKTRMTTFDPVKFRRINDFMGMLGSEA